LDDGVFAILYALLVVVLLGTAAVVVDLAMLRESRASTRSAADSAVVAAAASLNAVRPTLNDPRGGCQRAWKYLRTQLAGLPDGSADCLAFPAVAVPPSATCPASAIVATSTFARWTVRMTWPVADTNPLMTSPDLAPRSIPQAGDVAFDGTNKCERVALEVLKTNTPLFGGVFGAGDRQTRASSVARSIYQGDALPVLAALNILELTNCQALTTSGQGSIIVNGLSGEPGIIAVESNGRGTCNGGDAVIQPLSNALNFIRATGPNGSGDGLIQAYALNQPPLGNPSKAYTNASSLFPTPSLLQDKYGAGPVTNFFDCTTTCEPGGGPWIGQLKAAYGGVGVPPLAYTGSQTPYKTAAFTTLPNALYPGFVCNQNASSPRVVIPAGNWYVNCPGGLDVQTVLIFQGGVIVTAGSVNVGGGCLVVNVNVVIPLPLSPPAPPCPVTVNTAATPVTSSPAPAGDAIFYLRNGNLSKGAQASLFMPQTFTYLGDGRTDLGGGSGTLMWTTPLASDCAVSDQVCQNRRFKRLVLWSEKDALHKIGGQASLALRGVLFTPNAKSEFTGQAGSNQTAAQFWTRTLDVGGQGTLVMAVDPEAAIARPLVGVSLIR